MQGQAAVLSPKHAAGTLSQVGVVFCLRVVVLLLPAQVSALFLQFLLDLSTVAQQHFWETSVPR